jgi:hypothetical protein
MIEFLRFVFYLVWIIPALPGLIEQGKFEEDPEGYNA